MRSVCITALSLGTLLFVACRPPRRAAPPLILIYADLTSSVVSSEIVEVHHALRDIYNRAPEGSTIRVLAVQPVMAYAAPVAKTTVPVRPNDGIAEVRNDLLFRRVEADKAFAALAAAEAKVAGTVPASCLCDALKHAAGDIPPDGKQRVEVVLITDLVEECMTSIGGHRVIMGKERHITLEIAEANALAPIADLRGAFVSIIYPSSVDSRIDIARERPPADELKEFWQTVVSRCKPQGFSLKTDSESFHGDWQDPSSLLPLEAAKKVRSELDAQSINPAAPPAPAAK
jgi:hypothetical protein